jgi:hypothetical protein
MGNPPRVLPQFLEKFLLYNEMYPDRKAVPKQKLLLRIVPGIPCFSWMLSGYRLKFCA